jgi:uncharacterized protein
MSEQQVVGARTRIRRQPRRAVYDRETIYKIVDEAMMAHVGFVVDGRPFVIPMAVARRENEILLHGSSASRLMRHLSGEQEVCVNITHLDGVVLARSVFDTSMNYRSVVVFGQARVIANRVDKVAALRTMVEQLLPGRWSEARHPSESELRATTILALDISEASAKVRSGPPQDNAQDLQRPVWAGEIPLRTSALMPVPDPALTTGLRVPESVVSFVGRYSNDR